MQWDTFISTAIGAIAAIAGTVIVQLLVTRSTRKDEHDATRKQTYLDFALAAERAQAALRHVADPARQYDNIPDAARRAVSESGVYGAREKLLIAASPAVNRHAENVRRCLGDLRHAIYQDGARLHTPAFHDAYHPLADALWRLRLIAREEYGNEPLRPEDLDKESWDSQEWCDFCRAHRAQTTPPAPVADDHLATPAKR